MKAKINAEWDNLRKVAVHSPGIEMYFGLLDPFASLYERSFSMKEAIREHELLTYTLKQEFKVQIIPLKETIINKADKLPAIKEKLINLATEKISYTGDISEVKYAKYEAGKNRNIYVASDGVVVGSEMLLKNANVEIYQREGPGDYIKSPELTNLHDYIVSKGFEIIDITTLEYLAYASNFLCVKNGTIVSVEVDRVVKDVINNLTDKVALDPETYGNLLKQVKKDYNNLRSEGQFFPHKKEIYQQDIDAFPLNLINLTGGYGGAHCMTCALYRN